MSELFYSYFHVGISTVKMKLFPLFMSAILNESRWQSTMGTTPFWRCCWSRQLTQTFRWAHFTRQRFIFKFWLFSSASWCWARQLWRFCMFILRILSFLFPLEQLRSESSASGGHGRLCGLCGDASFLQGLRQLHRLLGGKVREWGYRGCPVRLWDKSWLLTVGLGTPSLAAKVDFLVICVGIIFVWV